jgi:hypothetical protein
VREKRMCIVEDSIAVNCCWPSPAQLFLISGYMVIFWGESNERHYILRAGQKN